jgi:hypothetical protein
MGGICGFAEFDDRELLRKMSGLISHRGSNEITFTDDSVGLPPHFYIRIME